MFIPLLRQFFATLKLLDEIKIGTIVFNQGKIGEKVRLADPAGN